MTTQTDGTKPGEATTTDDMFQFFKAKQREIWAGFAANEAFTTVAAGELVAFAKIKAADSVLDVGCGTGVVAVTAARLNAHAKGIDLTPVLLERARENASIAGVEVEFTEGDAEALPYADATFDVVLSQFGHMFAPRPDIATSEMLRVLKPGGRLAFTTWPPEHFTGRSFGVMSRFMPVPPPGTPQPAPPLHWGDPSIVQARLGDRVTDLRFGRATMDLPALSPRHFLLAAEANFGPLKTLLSNLDEHQPARAATLRALLLQLASESIEDNLLRQPYLMSLATKR